MTYAAPVYINCYPLLQPGSHHRLFHIFLEGKDTSRIKILFFGYTNIHIIKIIIVLIMIIIGLSIVIII